MGILSAVLELHFKSEDACDEFIGGPPYALHGNPESFRHFIDFTNKWVIIQHTNFPIKGNNPNTCLIYIVLEGNIVPLDVVDFLEALINNYEQVDGVYLCFYTVDTEYSWNVPVCGSFEWKGPATDIVFKELTVPIQEHINFIPTTNVFPFMAHCVGLLSTYHPSVRGFSISLPQRMFHDDPTEIKI